ncbi:MAG: tRNA epoxyqueuosine(34) reductase QueG [Bacteroidales bacterium]|jgi:epoxyqueuosine reductase
MPGSSETKTLITQWLKKEAAAWGFDFCGVAKAGFLNNHAPNFEHWLKAGMHGEMTYMENHYDKRVDPRKLVEGARTVIVFLLNYFPAREIPADYNYILSKYAYGKDYHYVIKEKLKTLIVGLKDLAGNIQARAFVDSAPVLERAWAVQAGLGWIGKNSLLINPKHGSYFFLAEIITDLELDFDRPGNNDFCGSCSNCIDACPTGAIVAPKIIDARRCISYLTIELKGEIPERFAGQFNDRIFGCDICQDVCPWNWFSKPCIESQFNPDQQLLDLKKIDWESLSFETFNRIFKDSAVKRTKFEGLKRNIAFIRKNET